MSSITKYKKNDRYTPARILIDENHKSWWESLGDFERRAITSLSVLLGVSVVGFTSYYLINRQIKKSRANKMQSLSFGQNTHATWAKMFKQAFDNDGWWGTDVPLVRATMRAIPSKEDFQKVVEAYKKMYKGANLINDMSDELTKLEYEEMLAIKNAKPDKRDKDGKYKPVYDPFGWARRLHAAVNYTWIGFLPGTDEDAIVAVFQEIPTKKAFYSTAVAYRKLYSVSLWEELDGDLNWSMDWRKLIKKK